MLDWTELFGQEEHDDDVVTIQDIPGLKLIRQALDHEQQMTLVHEIINAGYFAGADHINQAMCFGTLPSHIGWIASFVKKRYPRLFPQHIIQREPLFDQAILNLYQKGEGIVSHVDLLRFDDGILIISLLSSCVMTMKPAIEESTSYRQRQDDNRLKYDVLLRPGDILALSEDARYKWEHGIHERLFDHIDGEVIERGTRISVTLRKLKAESHSLADQTTVMSSSR
ncbi:hypothetical protein RMATCC62417_11203 [Rhizopus microsporus]|nr:hypothetical protein RMATCC62417_11203 [Rhizopus microsporus]